MKCTTVIYAVGIPDMPLYQLVILLHICTRNMVTLRVNVSLPIETLYNQVEDAMELVDAGQTPYSAPQVVAIAYSLVFNTWKFKDACRDWKRTWFIHKTWANFKVDLI